MAKIVQFQIARPNDEVPTIYVLDDNGHLWVRTAAGSDPATSSTWAKLNLAPELSPKNWNDPR